MWPWAFLRKSAKLAQQAREHRAHLFRIIHSMSQLCAIDRVQAATGCGCKAPFCGNTAKYSGNAGGRMFRMRNLEWAVPMLSSALLLIGCGTGEVSSGSFDRTYDVSGPIRLELTNASGS